MIRIPISFYAFGMTIFSSIVLFDLFLIFSPFQVSEWLVIPVFVSLTISLIFMFLCSLGRILDFFADRISFK